MSNAIAIALIIRLTTKAANNAPPTNSIIKDKTTRIADVKKANTTHPHCFSPHTVYVPNVSAPIFKNCPNLSKIFEEKSTSWLNGDNTSTSIHVKTVAASSPAAPAPFKTSPHLLHH